MEKHCLLLHKPGFPKLRHICERVLNVYLGHTYEENRTVHYDSSPPEVSNVYLKKNDVHELYVHDNTDLSTMNLHIEAKDAHSGISTLYWTFGIFEPELTLTDGYINIETIEGVSIRARAYLDRWIHQYRDNRRGKCPCPN